MKSLQQHNLTSLFRLKICAFCVMFLGLMTPVLCNADNALKTFSKLNDAGLIVLDSKGGRILAEHADKALIPASTTKLATAWLALQHWGEKHRFRTQFYYDETAQTLWVKGSGDPYLISEELDLIAKKLEQQGLKEVKAIGLDSSLFTKDLVLPGTENTNNPYDAVPTALAANFNTVNIRKVNGKIVSAEPNTPLTHYAKSLAGAISNGELRVNTGPNPHNAELYFGELLASFLQKNGVKTSPHIVFGRVPEKPVFYSHINSKTLSEIVRNMLKYSTNFIANQLILKLSTEHYKRPANGADVQRYMQETLFRRFGWKNFSFADGAGLSRTNRLSPRQLTELLKAFRQWKHLLPEIEPGIYAKSGTLSNVSALAGYFANHGEWRPFAIVMNEKVPYRFRNRIARELSKLQVTNVAGKFD